MVSRVFREIAARMTAPKDPLRAQTPSIEIMQGRKRRKMRGCGGGVPEWPPTGMEDVVRPSTVAN